MAVLHLKNDDFQTTVEAAEVAVVDFWATWCGPCKMIAPAIEALAQELDGKAVVAKVDVDEAGAIAQQFGVMSIPTIVILKNGKEVDRKVGVQSQAALLEAVTAHL